MRSTPPPLVLRTSGFDLVVVHHGTDRELRGWWRATIHGGRALIGSFTGPRPWHRGADARAVLPREAYQALCRAVVAGTVLEPRRAA